MAEPNKTYSWKETFRLSARGYKMLHQMDKRILPLHALSHTVRALSPFLTVWLSAKVVGELAGARRPDVLWSLVALTVGVIALISLLKGALDAKQKSLWNTFFPRRDGMFCDKSLDMDYADLESIENRDLRSQIFQAEGWAGWGLNILLHCMTFIMVGVLGVLGAIALTFGLFTAKVPAGSLAWLNSPLVLLGVLLVLTLVTVMGPVCANKAKEYFARAAQEAMFGNRLFTWLCCIGDDTTKAMDRRMYNQFEITEYYGQKDRTFSVSSPMARNSRGPAGAWAAAGHAATVAVTGCIYLFVCLKAWAGAFGIGEVTQYVGAVTMLTGSVGGIVEGIGYLKNNAPYLENLFKYFDIPNRMYQGSLTTEKRADRKYQVEFRDVSFKYPGADNWALRHVSIKFNVGSRLAVVGENGSGKTTFIKLLCRLYDPQEGKILLNGIDIRKYRYDDYMGIFSVVFQDFKLLSQSLGSNVAGCKDYNREKVTNALRDAGFEDRLAAMPQGLDTMLYKDFDQAGVEVSGGEAQKIAIARALYKDAPFIILDEPTAALDPIAEAEIYSKFNDIVTDKTAIYISHRLSSCRFCDEIAVFDHGQIVQTGTHDTLVEAEGKYKDLWNAQAQYYVEE